VRAQTTQPQEVIVVDGASTDGTTAVLETLRDQVAVVRTARMAPGAARNAGAAAARSEYLAFLDSDDLWMPWTLATMAEVIERNHRPAYICGSFRQFADRSELVRESALPLEAESFENYFSSWTRQFVIGAGMIVVRRDVFVTSGGFSPAAINMEDHDFSLKLGVAPGFVQIHQPLTLGWRRHGGGVTRDLDRSAAGCDLLIATERAGGYPGGAAWEMARRNIITTHTRTFSLECARAGRVREAFDVYRRTFAWHVALGRLKYLIMLPLLLVARVFQRRTA